ncbi:hypothetical protein GW17_00031678 [Ensete ventricosum]|nr:hypothetical protein GW17_00031678 [Ensete ventricosum]
MGRKIEATTHHLQAFRGKNIESAKSRLSICAEDIREQLQTSGDTPELCSQLGAVLGLLGDCWCVVDLAISLAKVADVDRNLGNEDVAIDGFKEAISCLESLKLEPYSEAGLEQRVVSFVCGISP